MLRGIIFLFSYFIHIIFTVFQPIFCKKKISEKFGKRLFFDIKNIDGHV